ncbi:PIN domain-like protein, partial [Mycena galericulata]
SIWMVQACMVHKNKTGTRWQLGKNAELRTLFYKLLPFIGVCACVVFVFDGPERPDLKRGNKVPKKPHFLAEPFQEMITACGFHFYTARGEADAELAYLNKHRKIDVIFTTDIDVFIFGATHVIQSPKKEDYANVAVYTARTIEDKAALTQGGFLLLAVLCGGDYDEEGLSDCGITIAHGLARRGMGDSLFLAAQTLSDDALQVFLGHWRDTLCNELANDPASVLGRRHKVLSQNVPPSFPSINILKLYTSPITSWSDGGTGPDDTNWGLGYPDINMIAKICQENFTWGSQDRLPDKLHDLVMPVLCIRRLRQPMDLERMLRDHVLHGLSDGELPSLTSFIAIKKYEAGYYCVEVSVQTTIEAAISSLGRSGGRTTATIPRSATKSIEVWIPASILQRALPGMVEHFRNMAKSMTRKSKPRSLQVTAGLPPVKPSLPSPLKSLH